MRMIPVPDNALRSLAISISTISLTTSRGVKCSPAVSLDISEKRLIKSSKR